MSRDDRIQLIRLRPLKAQRFGGHFAYRVGTARSQRLQQLRCIGLAAAIPAADVEKATTEIRCSERRRLSGNEIDAEIFVSVLERLGDARARREMNERIRANRRNLFAELPVAHVLMLGQRGEGPAIPMLRGRMFCEDPAHEAGMAGDQQLGHGVARGTLRSIKKRDTAALFMLPGS